MQERLFRKVALERASSPDRLDSLMQVTQPRGWLVLGMMLIILALLAVWSFTASISTTVDGQGVLVQNGNDLQAVLYLSAEQIQNVTVGDNVLVAPVSISTQQYGYLEGQVISVGTQPSTASEASFAVTITLQKNTQAATGYRWTIAQGPNTTLRPTAITGTIIVAESRPIDQLIPNA